MKLLKGPVKITHILIPHLLGDGIHRHIRILQHLFGGQDTLLLDVFDKALAGGLFQKLADIGRTEMEVCSRILQGSRPVIVVQVIRRPYSRCLLRVTSPYS